MVNLGDYIGQLMNELTIARVQVDLEVARVAELYSRHELLKHFPIPKIRFSDFEVEVPVLITEVKDNIDEKNMINKIGERYESVLNENLSKNNISLSKETIKMSHKLVLSELKKIENSPTNCFDFPSISKRISPVLIKTLRENGVGDEDALTVVKQIEADTKDYIIDEISDKQRLKVAVTSSEIKEADASSIVRLSLKATEEGVEWTQISLGDDEKSVRRLVVE